jgi:hypothetical protein
MIARLKITPIHCCWCRNFTYATICVQFPWNRLQFACYHHSNVNMALLGVFYWVKKRMSTGAPTSKLSRLKFKIWMRYLRERSKRSPRIKQRKPHIRLRNMWLLQALKRSIYLENSLEERSLAGYPIWTVMRRSAEARSVTTQADVPYFHSEKLVSFLFKAEFHRLVLYSSS